MVYVATSPNLDGVKVGWTTEPEVDRRRVKLEVQFRAPMRIEFVTRRFADAFRVERRAHQILARKAIGKEWFLVGVYDAIQAIEEATRDVADGWVWPRMACHDARMRTPPDQWPERWKQ